VTVSLRLRIENRRFQDSIQNLTFSPSINKTSIEMASKLKAIYERIPEILERKRDRIERQRQELEKKREDLSKFQPIKTSAASERYLKRNGALFMFFPNATHRKHMNNRKKHIQPRYSFCI
jgi:hypothetical protein